MLVLIPLGQPQIGEAQIINRRLSDNPEALGGSVSSAQVSPDGRYAVYTADQRIEGKLELWSVRAAGGRPVRLATADEGYFSKLLFQISPDSRFVFYTADSSLFRIAIDGKSRPELILGELDVSFEGWVYYRSVQSLKWSADGRYLFIGVGLPVTQGRGIRVADLYRLEIESGRVQKVTESTKASQQEIEDYQISWNGEVVLLEMNRYEAVCELYTLRIEDGVAHCVERSPGAWGTPYSALSADGEWVLFKEFSFRAPTISLRIISTRGGESVFIAEGVRGYWKVRGQRRVVYSTYGGVYSVDIDTLDTIQLSPGEGVGIRRGAGGRVLWVTGEGELFSVLADGTGEAVILNRLPVEGTLTFSPDAKAVVFCEMTKGAGGEPVAMIAPVDGSAPAVRLIRGDHIEPRSLSFSNDGEWLVFQRDTPFDELRRLYAVPTKGGTPRSLFESADRGRGPFGVLRQLSQDGQFFVHAEGELFLSAGWDAGVVRMSSPGALIEDVVDFEMSSDGKYVAFATDIQGEGVYEFSLLRTDGRDRKRFTVPSEGRWIQIVPTPDGRFLAGSQAGIWIVDPTSGGMEPLPAPLGSRFVGFLDSGADALFHDGRHVISCSLVGEAPASAPAQYLQRGSTGEAWRFLSGQFDEYAVDQVGERIVFIGGTRRDGSQLWSWDPGKTGSFLRLSPAGEAAVVFVPVPALNAVVLGTREGLFYLADVETGDLRKLDLGATRARRLKTFFATDDGRWLVFDSGDALYRLSLKEEATAREQLSKSVAPGCCLGPAMLAMDGDTVVFPVGNWERMEIHRLSVRENSLPTPIWSGDGWTPFSWIEMMENSMIVPSYVPDAGMTLSMLPLWSGEDAVPLARGVVYRSLRSGYSKGFELSSDRRQLVYRTVGADGRDDLLSRPIRGGKATRLHADTGRPHGARIHDWTMNQDGSRVVYVSDQRLEDVDELFVSSLVGLAEPASFDRWLGENFADELLQDSELEPSQWGARADPDGDGLSNRLEWFAGLDPVAHQGIQPLEIRSNDGTAVLSFRQSKTFAGRATVEWSQNLRSWHEWDGPLSISGEESGAWQFVSQLEHGVAPARQFRIRFGED